MKFSFSHYAVGDREHLPSYPDEEEVCRGAGDPDSHLDAYLQGGVTAANLQHLTECLHKRVGL